MSDKLELPILLVVAGVAIGAIAVFIYTTQVNRLTITDLTRDTSGRIISIVERRV